MTLDSVSYIGQYSKNTPNLYVATGFNKWGMTSSMVGAELLKDLVMGKENPYKEVFSPSRSILQPQLAVNAFEFVRCVGEMLSYVPESQCSEKSVAQRMYGHIAVGMRYASDRTFDQDSAKPQWKPLCEGMYIVSVSYSYVHIPNNFHKCK